MIFLKGFAVWIVLIAAESLHGIARTLLLAPQIGDFQARQVSVFTGLGLIFAIAIVFVKWIDASRSTELIGVGLLWLISTVAFELSLGRFVFGYSWERIASDYNLLKGGLLSIGLVGLTFAPLVAGKVRHLV